MTPKQVNEIIDFSGNQEKYNETSKNLFSLQLEGVAGIINRLDKYNIALLADEVGMGKTLQALGVMAMKYKENSNLKTLIIVPNRNIARQWRDEEYTNFKIKHLKKDCLPKRSGTIFIENFSKDEIEKTKNKKIVFAKITSFSYSEDKVKYGNYEKGIKKYLKNFISNFDFVIIDESHKLRSNEDTNRIKFAKSFFENLKDKAQILLLTATPVFKHKNDLKRVLILFKQNINLFRQGIKNIEDISINNKEIMQKIAIRRLRVMSNGTVKYEYRRELARKAGFNKNKLDENELFFALIQKEAIKKDINLSKSKTLLDFMEGIEFESENEENSNEIEKFVNEIQNKLNISPSNPKYNELFAQINLKEKYLIFVNRVASAYNIAREYIKMYDECLWSLIVKRLKRKYPYLKDKKMPNTRKTFNELFNKLLFEKEIEKYVKKINWENINLDKFKAEKAKEPNQSYVTYEKAKKLALIEFFETFEKKQLKEEFKNFIENYKSDDENNQEDTKVNLKSAILDFFVTKKNDISTPASRFVKKLHNKKSPYYNFFKTDFFEILEEKENIKLNETQKILIKNAILYASEGVVELFIEDIRGDRKYDDFKKNIEQRWNTLLFIKEIKEFIKYYNKFEKYLKFNENQEEDGDYSEIEKHFKNKLPAYPFTGHTKNKYIISQFNSPFFPKILIGTSTLQEGVNLHLFCDKVIHFGIPYSFGSDEQRIGRVDRVFGKLDRELENKEKTLDISYVFLEKSFDEIGVLNLLTCKRKFEDVLDSGDKVIKEECEFEDKQISELLYSPNLEKCKIKEPYPWKSKK